MGSEIMKRFLSFIVLLALALTAQAVPVNHEAPDGVAAFDIHQIKNRPGLVNTEVVVGHYALTKDGVLFVQLWPANPSKAPDWKRVEIEWPVPFADIADWTPSPMYPATKVPELAAGVIVTKSGAVWRMVPKFAKSWDQGTAMSGTEWDKLELKR